MAIRTAYFLDIDNLVGNGLATPSQVAEVLAAFESACSPGPQDLVYCAATAKAAYEVKLARPGYRVLIGHGKDGADLQLLSMADIHVLARQFQRVVLGSGDAIFRPLVAELRCRGLTVELVRGRGLLSHHLYRAVAPASPGGLAPITTLRLAA
ncbi:MAG: NYN domain-containing protein [Actinobacteria bacterium]|jgi:hypothetical protein|nr:NYN domain-containing protein [Actinomycetota bacterium]